MALTFLACTARNKQQVYGYYTNSQRFRYCIYIIGVLHVESLKLQCMYVTTMRRRRARQRQSKQVNYTTGQTLLLFQAKKKGCPGWDSNLLSRQELSQHSAVEVSALPTELYTTLPTELYTTLPTELPGQLGWSGFESSTQHNTRQTSNYAMAQYTLIKVKIFYCGLHCTK